jgi:hypothetical protein
MSPQYWWLSCLSSTCIRIPLTPLSFCRPGARSREAAFELRPRASTRERGARTSEESNRPQLRDNTPTTAARSSPAGVGHNPYELFSGSGSSGGGVSKPASVAAVPAAAEIGSRADASPYAAFAAGGTSAGGATASSTRAVSAASPYEAFAGAGGSAGGVRAPSAASPYEVFARSSGGSDSLARSSGPDIYAAFSRPSVDEGSPAGPPAPAAAATMATMRPAAAAAAAGSRKLGTARGDVRRSSLKKQGARVSLCAALELRGRVKQLAALKSCTCCAVHMKLQCLLFNDGPACSSTR